MSSWKSCLLSAPDSTFPKLSLYVIFVTSVSENHHLLELALLLMHEGQISFCMFYVVKQILRALEGLKFNMVLPFSLSKFCFSEDHLVSFQLFLLKSLYRLLKPNQY